MPYRRTYSRRPVRRYRRRTTGRRSTFSKYSGYMNTAMKALTLARYVKSVINTEYKYHDTTGEDYAVSNAAYGVFPLNLIAEGDDNNQRNGRSVLAKHLSLRMTVNLAGALDHAVVRLVVLTYKSCQGAYPNTAEIYTDPTGAFAVNSFREISSANFSNYRLLWDKRISLDGDYKSEIKIDKYFKFNTHLKYIGAGDTIDNVGQNGLFFMLISDNAFSVTDFVNLNFNSRLRYIDN